MRYELSCQVTVSAYTIVEAPSLEEAIKIAEDRSVVIGDARSGADVEEEWVIGEADGTPQEIHQAG